MLFTEDAFSADDSFPTADPSSLKLLGALCYLTLKLWHTAPDKMSFWDEANGEECGDTFATMFASRDAKDEKFFFEDIVISQQSLTFQFSFCNEINFESVVLLDVAIDENCSSIMRNVFSIGMCVCSWYWMGYYTSEIIISQKIIQSCFVSADMMKFWDMLYHNISLEYVYVNKIPYQRVRFVLEGGAPNKTERSFFPTTSCAKLKIKHSVIIPMGGGKDSLVVWHEYKQSHSECSPLLLYVADGFEEYAQSWRLQGVMTQTGDDLVLVRHDFQNVLLHQMKRSYLKPCAHPWAALVLFDSLLMAQLTGIYEVTLGYERSADEGNKIYVQVPVSHSTADQNFKLGQVPTAGEVVLEEVNHQYDKSSAFLAQGQAYINTFINCDVHVVSTLHGLWEIQISKLFCEAPKLQAFLSMFLSCNEPTATCDWCKRCDKCAFIFLLLSAHLPPLQVVNTVFGGENMLNNPLCRGLFTRLIGNSSEGKPLDCVGTVQEASAAAHLSAVQYSRCISWRKECAGDNMRRKEKNETGVIEYNNSEKRNVKNSTNAQSGTDNAICSTSHEGPLPVLLRELCGLLCIECDPISGVPVVSDEDAILKLWGICD